MKKQKQTVTPDPWSTGGVADPYGPHPHTSVYGKAPEGAQSGPLVCRGMSVPDGNLIAAAPELLHALRNALEYLEGDRGEIDTVTDAEIRKMLADMRAAIDKAEGREGAGLFEEEIVVVGSLGSTS